MVVVVSTYFVASIPSTPPIVSFERIVCFKIVATTGEGIEGDPFRWVTLWKTEDGETVAYHDPFAEDSNTESSQS